MRRGLFVTFEGSEGCGKSTQIRRLAATLTAAGEAPILAREPGGTLVGDQIRHVLQYSHQSDHLVPEAELLLFCASRAQLVREVIRPALAAGRLGLCDRFHDSTTVYQGVARRLAPDQVAALNAFAVDGCLPDLTFLLDMDAQTALTRLRQRTEAGQRRDRMEQEPPAFYEAVRSGYLDLAAGEPHRFRVLDATLPEEDLASSILDILRPLHHGLSAR